MHAYIASSTPDFRLKLQELGLGALRSRHMGMTSGVLPSSCASYFRSGLVRVRSPLSFSPSWKLSGDTRERWVGNGKGTGYLESETALFTGGRRIMVVVDSCFEDKGALQWALSRSVQCQDTIVLFHVTKPSNKGTKSKKRKLNQRAYERLHLFKSICQKRRPGVRVEVALVEGKKKGTTIVEEAKQRSVSLLVLGQRKRSMMCWLGRLWAGNQIQGGRGVVEYCIQNASCMTVAVKRKDSRHGGYLITTQHHKNFWLLA